MRQLIECLGRVRGAEELQARVVTESIAWCRAEKRSFLRMRLELRLATLCVGRCCGSRRAAALRAACGARAPHPPPPHRSRARSLLSQQKYHPALAVVSTLLREVKWLDDKQLLVEIHLVESRCLHLLRNVPKARAALTASRTAANSLYVGPELQAEIDLQAGTLHAEERDFRTAYSYFFEAYEGLTAMGSPAAVAPLKYMLLCKVMAGASEDVAALLGGKAGLRHAGPAVEGMRAIAAAHKARSLLAFERALADFSGETVADPLISRHLAHLADVLFEANLLRLIEPFSCVQIEHLAELIALPLERVETKLSQIILDGKVSGTLDQGRGLLLVFERPAEDPTCAAALKTVKNLGDVVDVLQRRAEALK